MTNYWTLGAPIVFTVYLLLIFIHCISRRYRTENPNAGSISPTIIGRRMSRKGNRGLDPAVIETFPTFQYSVVKGLKLGKGALECSVCLNEFEEDETIRLLPKCDHVFHPECIDAWLTNRTTCPVCRANLVPESAQTNATTVVPIQELEGESEGEIGGSETVDLENQQVSIQVINEEEPPTEVGVTLAVAAEVINPVQMQMQNRPSRSTRRRYAGRFSRSHSMGTSLVQPGENIERFTLRLPEENIERFTLRLPEEVRKQIMKKGLNRAVTMTVFPTEGVSRQGYRNTGEGSSRGGREGWMDVFSMMPPFFMRRESSALSPKMTAEGNATVIPPPPPPAKL